MAFRLIAFLLVLSCMPSVSSADVATVDSPSPRVLILVYHRFATARLDSMTVRTETLRNQLREIEANGYRIVPLADVVRWHGGQADAVPARAVAITVDDGHRSVYEVLRPLLAAHPMPVTLFIYPSAISNASYAMTWDQLRMLGQSGGFDIESHTYWHPNFRTERARLTPDDYLRFVSFQLSRSRERLESETGQPVRMLAWPFGVHDAQTDQLAAREGYVAAFTLDARPVRIADPAMALPRYLMTDACDTRCMNGLLRTAGGEAVIERLIVCLLVSLAGFAARAAPVTITVVDATNGRPLAGAIGHAPGANRTADRDGAFSLDIDAAGTRLSVRAPGYARTEVTLAPAEGAQTIRMTPVRPKAVYLSAYGVADRTLREAALSLQDKTAINALVIDVKGDSGVTPYRSLAREISGASNNVAGAIVRPPDLPDLLRTFHARGLYLIARIVVFKDDALARAHPEWAVRDAAGEIWQDREHQRWIDPTSHAAWQHNYDVAEEAARMGFDEIQFDYLRFPDANGLRFAEPNTEANRVAAITGFLTGARERLRPYNLYVSADIFGYVCWNADDTAIGQRLDALGPVVDYVSPMLYPSGFTWGLPGCRKPTEHPGEIVSRSLAEAKRRTGLDGVRFRPWLQAFRDYAFDHRPFDADEIRAQVDAADAAGTDGWMLWNPRNRYDPADLPR